MAFEELGGLIAEGGLAYLSVLAVDIGLIAAGSTGIFPFLLIPGVGLVLIVAAGAAGALSGNIGGKLIGRELYDWVEPLFRDATLEMN